MDKDRIAGEMFEDSILKQIELNRYNRLRFDKHNRIIGDYNYLQEYCMIQNYPGRRCGKTTFIKKMLDADPSNIAVVKSYRIKQDHYRSYLDQTYSKKGFLERGFMINGVSDRQFPLIFFDDYSTFSMFERETFSIGQVYELVVRHFSIFPTLVMIG